MQISLLPSFNEGAEIVVAAVTGIAFGMQVSYRKGKGRPASIGGPW